MTTETTTPREITLEAFKLKKPDRVPVGVCLGGSWPFFIRNASLADLLDDPIKTASIFYEVNERVDADFITVGTGATALLFQGLGGKIEFSSKGAPSIASILVESESDIDRLDISRAIRSERVQWLRAVAKETVRLNRGRRSLFISGRAPFTLAGQLAGLEMFTKSLYKNKRFVDRLLDFTLELSAAYYEFMLGADGLDGVFIADPSASGDVLSARHFEGVVLPKIVGLLKRLAPYERPSLLHICGNITDRLHLLPETGVGMISVDSKVDLRLAREILGGKIGLAGNVHPVFVLEDMSPGEVAEKTRECLAAAAGGGGFMLLPGCDLSSKVPEENVCEFVRTAHAWMTD
ncbi:MAG: hypothetical protein LBT08_02235 [Synergistaceae bacterium]|nr:hypothetical protein [Synergistaceae bacterium]